MLGSDINVSVTISAKRLRFIALSVGEIIMSICILNGFVTKVLLCQHSNRSSNGTSFLFVEKVREIFCWFLTSDSQFAHYTLPIASLTHESTIWEEQRKATLEKKHRNCLPLFNYTFYSLVAKASFTFFSHSQNTSMRVLLHFTKSSGRITQYHNA